MRKCSGPATISILSTMVLVTLNGSLNIFIGGQNYWYCFVFFWLHDYVRRFRCQMNRLSRMFAFSRWRDIRLSGGTDKYNGSSWNSKDWWKDLRGEWPVHSINCQSWRQKEQSTLLDHNLWATDRQKLSCENTSLCGYHIWKIRRKLEINVKTFTLNKKLGSTLSKGNSLNWTCFNTKCLYLVLPGFELSTGTKSW